MQTQETQSKITPEIALKMLKEGNKRFVESKLIDRDFIEEVKKTSNIQFPFATVFSCMDSRVVPAVCFDQGIGDIFILKIAGNTLNDDILGSMEFSCKAVGSRLIIVMGHTDCRAIKDSIDNVKMGHLSALLEKITPAVDALNLYEGEKSSSNPDFVIKVNEQSIRMTINKIRMESDILREMEKKGEIILTGAMYDNETGEVNFID